MPLPLVSTLTSWFSKRQCFRGTRSLLLLGR